VRREETLLACCSLLCLVGSSFVCSLLHTTHTHRERHKTHTYARARI
jgi:hypothetical protein